MRDDPIFLLAPTWRCGSTYMQRVLNAARDPRTGPPVIWGEIGGLVARFAEGVKGLEVQLAIGGKRQRELFFQNNERNGWTAMMSPRRAAVVQALRDALAQIYSHKDCRWGFKEIRYGEREVVLLHEMFPRAKFVFVVRDVRLAIRSYLTLGWNEGTPETMAKAWAERVAFFRKFSTQRPNVAVLTKQEDASMEECRKVLRHVGLKWDEDAIQKVVQKDVYRLTQRKELSPDVEKMVLGICGPTLHQLYA